MSKLSKKIFVSAVALTRCQRRSPRCLAEPQEELREFQPALPLREISRRGRPVLT